LALEALEDIQGGAEFFLDKAAGDSSAANLESVIQTDYVE
jgi:hypothetical protein